MNDELEISMSFWNDLPTYTGKSNFGVILLDKLAQEQSSGGWVAGLTMYTHKFNSKYYLSNKSLSNWGVFPLEKVSVYFLSWKVDDISKVSFKALQGFDYFLTSEFSGCRFVVTEFGVAHVAWSAGGHRATGNASQQQRDAAEYDALSYAKHPPKYRRRLSISNSDGALDTHLVTTHNTNNTGQSYNNERAIVFGYRINGGWAFKVLRYKPGKSEEGTWSNFASVWSV